MGSNELASDAVRVFLGPQAATLRDLEVPYRWDGLSGGDSAVLARFLASLAVKPDELHTHVPVGGAGLDLDPVVEAACPGMTAWLMPHRLDAALRFGDEWWLCECKSDCRAHGLGQCLCYFYWWCRDVPGCRCARVLLLCAETCADEAAVYRACGVEVVVV